MELDQDLLFSDAVPADAKRLLDEAEATVAQVREGTRREIAAIRDAGDREITRIRERIAAEEAEVNTRAGLELSPVLRNLFSRLKELQANHLLAGRLDEALAIRSRLRGLRSDLFDVKPDPGNMTDYASSDIGKSYLFDITGSTEGSIWGNDRYTGDSRVDTAAVHSGALRPGERGVVRVTLVDGSESVFESVERHGVQSLEYGNYTVSYAVERV